MDEALAKLEREVAQNPSDEARLRALCAAKQRSGWTYAGRGFEHWVAQLFVQDDDARDHRTDRAFHAFGIAAVPTLLEAMANGASFPASCAFELLGTDAVRAAAPALRRLAETTQGEVRGDALLLLERHTPFDVVPIFEREIADPEEEVRERALYRVAQLASHEAVVPHLVRALSDPAPLVRRHAARLLAPVVDPLVRLEDVVAALLSQDVSGARAPEEPTFETIAGQDAIPAFLSASSDPDPMVRRRAIRLLAVQQHGPYRAAIGARFAAALADDEPTVRTEAADGLRHLIRNGLDPMHPIPAVLAMLDQPEGRLDALWALSSVGTAEVAVPILTSFLADAGFDVRRTVLAALGHRRAEARPALPRLLAMLDTDESLMIQAPLRESITQIGVDPGHLPLVERLLQSHGTRLFAASLLVDLGAPGANLAPTLLALHGKESRDDARRVLAEALLAMGQSVEIALPARIRDIPYYVHTVGGELPQIVARLAESGRLDLTIRTSLASLLEHSSETTRVVAAHALAAAGATEIALPALLELLARASDPDDRARAAASLGGLRMSTTSVLVALTWALEHDEVQVAVAAAEALNAFGPSTRSVTEALERALASNDRNLSWAARLALDAVRAG